MSNASNNKNKSFDNVVGDNNKAFFEPEQPKLYAFFSFDLVNSTMYKEKQKDLWTEIFLEFYSTIISEMKEEFPRVRVWKYIGDEVLFYYKLETQDIFFKIVPSANAVLNSTKTHLEGKYKKDFKPLSIKGTVWCAPIVEFERVENEKSQKNHKNFKQNLNFDDNNVMIDFIGPDIDIGFRISQYTVKNKIVVSADMAYLLLIISETNKEVNELIQQLKIVSYKKLKGVWNDRYYPIIWFYKDWDSINQTFEYDDRFRSEIIDTICKKNFEAIDNLEAIFKQVDLFEEKKELSNALNTIPKKVEQVSPNYYPKLKVNREAL